MNNSKLLSLNWHDIIKALLVAFLTTFVATIGQSLDAGIFPTLAQIKVAALSGLAAAVAYLAKNLFTNSNGQILKTNTEFNPDPGTSNPPPGDGEGSEPTTKPPTGP